MKTILAILFAVLLAVAPLTAVAKGAKVRSCRIVHNHRVCLIVAGGSGITPPVLRR